MRFLITTLGCKVNQYDGQAVAAALERCGFERAAGDDRGVDLVVINTCCVTATAMRKSRQAIRRAVRSCGGAAVLVVGCYGDYDGRRIGNLLAELNVPAENVAIAGHHDDLAARVEALARRLGARDDPSLAGASSRPNPRAEPWGNDVRMTAACDARITASPSTMTTRRQAAVKGNVPGAAGLGPIQRFAGHQRAFVKVQDGCDAFCTYCIVPYTRPRVWSRSSDQIVAECRRLVAAGHREIVLCGVFLGAFGQRTAVRRRWEAAAPALAALLRRVAAIDGLWRVRLSSLQPGDVTDDLLAACGELPNAAPHFHLPLQSGSQRILRQMNRQYTVAQYRRSVSRVRSALDRPAITTDVIVGFPGESGEQFRHTVDVARRAAFSRIHVFPYSDREGTAAFRMGGKVPRAVIQARRGEMLAVARELSEAYHRRFIGRTVQPLVEARRDRRTGLLCGYTERYVRTFFEGPDELSGKLAHVRVAEATPRGVRGIVTLNP